MKKLAFILVMGYTFGLVHAQDGMNKVVFDEKANQEILYGYCDKEGLTGDLFNDWFEMEYGAYEIDEETLNKLSPDILAEIKIEIVLGTWCSDSRREVPRFYRMIEFMDLDQEQITVIGVNRLKKAENTSVPNLDIEFVPTFIIYYGDKEIGRIIESPLESLEKDMLNIISEI